MAKDISKAVKSDRLIVAHRGARSLAPENTLAAARKALSAGAQMWEIDVRLTRDGELVVIHDSALVRTSDVKIKFPNRMPWNVHDFTLEEVRSLDCGSWFNSTDPFGQIQAGAVSSGEQAIYIGEPIPTFKEAILFTLRNDWLVNIEIKDLSGLPGNDEIVSKVVDLVLSLNAIEKILISSFNHEYLLQIKRLERNIKTGALVSRPHYDPVQLMADLGSHTFHPGIAAVRPWQFRSLRESGSGILVWVVNNPKLARALFKMGVQGIFTDFPQVLTKEVKVPH